MRRIKFIVSLCMVLATSSLALADDKAAPDTGAMPPMGPPAELAFTKKLVGVWTTDFQMKMTPADTAWTMSKATWTWSPIAGGAAYMGAFVSSMMGMPFEGCSIATYNRDAKQFEDFWVDNMAARLDKSTGNIVDGKLVMNGQSADPMTGKMSMTRETTNWVSDTQFNWTFEMSEDGGKTWWVSMKAAFHKKA